MAGYIGTTPVPQATQHRESFTATGGQTSFATAGYTPQFIDVYLNGVKLAPADYTATNGSDVVLASGATASDILEIVAYTPFEVANQTFTGDTSVTNLAVTGTFTSRGIDDNADAVAITIDSSENVGIGVTSNRNSTKLDVLGDITFGENANYYGTLAYNAGEGFLDITSGDGGFRLFKRSGPTELIRISSTGNVGIGTTSTAGHSNHTNLFLGGTGNIYAEKAATADASLHISQNAHVDTDGSWEYRVTDEATNYYQYAGTHVWRYAASGTAGNDISWSEAMRLSSGNLLVGKTSTSVNTQGIILGYNGRFYATSDGAESAVFNRKTSDGVIASFRKDNTTVGSIGTTGGDLYIATGDTGIRFDDSADQIRASTSAGSNRDGAIDIGFTDSRFKDLYLSGGVYLGGTGAANKLDDYEEGTWTPAVSNMTVTGTLTTAGRYTKVGRMVSLMGWVSATTSIAHGVSALISGFPFAGASVTGELQSRSAGVIVAGANADLPSSNHSAACFVDSPNSRAFLGNFTTTAANEYIYINVVYYTA